MTSKSHFLRLATQDYLTCRARMRSAVTGDWMLRVVYLEALVALHEAGGSLSADPKVLADKLALPAAEIERCLPILDEIARAPESRGGLLVADGRITNRRVADELRAENAYREHQSEVGKIGGLKAGKGRPAQTDVRATPNNEEGYPKPSVSVTTTTTTTNGRTDGSPGPSEPTPPPASEPCPPGEAPPTPATAAEAGRVALARLGPPPDREGPKRNPLVTDRPALERECLELVAIVAKAENRDPVEVMGEYGGWKGQRKVNPASMSDDRLLNTVLDLRKRVAALQPKPPAAGPRVVDADEAYRRKREEFDARRGPGAGPGGPAREAGPDPGDEGAGGEAAPGARASPSPSSRPPGDDSTGSADAA